MKLLLTIFLIHASCSLFGQLKGETKAVLPDSSSTAIEKLSQQNYDLSEIQITAYRTQGLLKSTAGSVSVITADRLENSAINITSSLSTVPGIVMQEGTLGTVKLTLRGIGSRYPYGTKKIKLFFGDIPMYSAEGETTFDDINPEYLSRIEVLRGPASSIHGASLGGTIILYPRRAEFNLEEINLNSSIGSYGYFKNGVSYSLGTNKNDLLISLSGIQSDGYRENNKYNRNSFFINQNRTFSKNLSGNLILSGSKIRAQIPSSIDSATFVNHPQKAAANWLNTKGYEHPDRIFAGYSLRYHAPKEWEFSSSVFLNSRKTEENRPFNYLDESGFAYGGRILSQHTKKQGSTTIHFLAGTNLFFENVRSSLSENIGGNGIKGTLQQKGKESIYQTDLFTQLEAKIKRITITGGANLNFSGFQYIDQFTSDTLNQSGNYNFAPILAPRLSISWNPFDEIYLYTSVNKGFSIPSLSETLSPLGLINRDIKPEKAWSFEGGFRASLLHHATFIDLAFYYMRVTDLIVPKRVAEDVYVGMNAGSSLHRGIEMAVQQWIIGHKTSDRDRSFALIANLNFATNRFNFQNFTENNIDYSGNKLPGMPDQNFSGSLDLKTPTGFYTQFELNTSGKIPLNDLNSQYSNGWLIMNLKVGYILDIFKKLRIDATMKVNNLTDEKYASMVVVNAMGTTTRPPRYFYPGLPRWFTCTINLSYKNFKKQL
ncbi:MAG TPA: TonB-dependent receptor [Anaerovoracaceae bacterium]|nr:TonB-dependent receptor [Anaerovoracaceae bacterium]